VIPVLVSAMLATLVVDLAGAQQAWSVAGTPTVEIPAVSPSGAVHFDQAVGAARLPSGEIAVADRSGAVRIFNPSGQPVRREGRQGSGPNEFQALLWMGSCGGDSLVAWDLLTRRLTVLSPEGRIHRQTAAVTGAAPFLVACSRAGGNLVAQGIGHDPPARPGDPIRGTSPVVLLDRDGAAAGVVAVLPSGELSAFGGGGAPRPLGKSTHLAASRQYLYVTTGDSAVVLRYTRDGKPAGVLRTPAPPRAPTSRQRELAVEDLLGMVPPQARQSVRAMLASEAPPERLPPFSRLLVDAEDRLWVVLSHPGEGRTRLRALDENGGTLAELTIPADLTVYEIGRDYLLARFDDADGEQSIRLYPIRR
jgi:hypothetical protein